MTERRERREKSNNEERGGGGLEIELGQPESAYPWSAMRVCVYTVKHSKVLQSVVKFIRFVFADMAALNSAMLPLPLNYVQLELDMNIE